MRICSRFIASYSLLALFAVRPALADEPTPQPQTPKIAAASAEAERAIQGFRVPAGLAARLFAAEPMLANPVAFCLDERGRVYVCESFRQSKGIEDNRSHDHWLDDDLAAQTVEDRLAYIRKHLAEKAIEYTHQDDRLRLIEDENGDGVADKSTVFADRFNGIVEGTGAGVLARRGNVFYTCIPKLWLLRDEDGNGQAEVRRPLHHGYGVRFAFRGHDLHGLVIGPDGKLYYSIGDRGYNVPGSGLTIWANPESGAVFRCNLDGSDLEVLHTGLRNPQELAFDDYGNLFTGDNNSDSGDQARWVHVVEGGDSGWRMAYQYLGDRGPFNREKLWNPQHEGQPAYIVPPVANIASGPAGLAYYPGTGLADHFQRRFFLCDFRGGPANSGVRTFRVKPKGAGFELVDAEETIWRILATDVDFGPDGALYVSDWVDGWNGEGKGRLYRFVDPSQAAHEIVQEVKKLLAEDLTRRPDSELEQLLAHADRRVRQEAQFALVDKRSVATLTAAAGGSATLSRLHAIWGLGQIAATGFEARKALGNVQKLLDDPDAEVRAQTAKVLGEGRHDPAKDKLTSLLKDENARVRFFAALGVGKLKHAAAIGPLLEALAENEDRDVTLRHALIMGLAGAGDEKSLKEATRHHSPAVRLAVAVALRKQKSPLVAELLADIDPRVAIEAARAIHDEPIPAAMRQLAAMAPRVTSSDPFIRRALSANFRLGQAEHAGTVASVAAKSGLPHAVRIEALQMLAAWEKPSARDRVLNQWRPLEKRDPSISRAALSQVLPGVFSGSPRVAAEGAKVAAALGIKEVGPALVGILEDKSLSGSLRADALAALLSLKNDRLNELTQTALTDANPEVRAAARNALARIDPQRSLAPLEAALAGGELIEQQAALSTLGTLRQPGVDDILSRALAKLAAGEIPAGARLDLLEAARERESEQVKEQLAGYEAAPKDDPLAQYAETLAGGNADRGRQIFFERTQVSCVRCHKAHGVGGDVGPDLTKIGAEKQREYLLESIVLPSKAIAKNFDTVTLVTVEGQVLSGILRQEDEKQIRLINAEGKLIDVPKEDIDQRRVGKSSMPEDLVGKLTRPELRDLLEYLSSLK